jgi:hypothetical protein
MRNLPRFALVPLVALLSAIPLVALSVPAGADTLGDCTSAFSSQPEAQLSYNSDPPARSDALPGQPIHLSAGWDPAAWDGLTSAVACVRVDSTFDEGLGGATDAPADTGAFDHTFTVPDGVVNGTVLCTRIRLAGDPAGDATEAVWVSKTHCFEVHPPEEATTTTTGPLYHPPTTQPPATTTATVPTAAPATSSSTPGGDTPTSDNPQGPVPFSPEGGGSPVGTPFDSAEATPSSGPGTPAPGPTNPDMVPLLPATGFASTALFHRGELCLFTGLALLVLVGLPRRRRCPVT